MTKNLSCTASHRQNMFWVFLQKGVMTLFLSLFCAGICTPPVVMAAETPAPESISQKIAEISAFVVHLFTPIIGVEISLVGTLMDNDFILGDATLNESANGNTNTGDQQFNGMGEFLQEIWQVVRDLVNYVFIAVLIIVAFMTVLTAGAGSEKQLNLGQILPRFVIAVVAVNFTWFGAKVVLDVATVATDIVYSIPLSIGNKVDLGGECIHPREYAQEVKDDPKTKKRQCVFTLKKTEFVGNVGENKTIDDLQEGGFRASRGWCDPDNEDKDNPCDGEDYLYDMGLMKLYFKKFESWDQLSSSNIAAMFAYNLLHIERLPLTEGSTGSGTDLTIKVVVALLMMIIVLSVFTVMFFVVLERIIVIWVNIILSPIGVLVWALKGSPLEINAESSDSPLGWKAFIDSVFLPVYMGVPLVFGILMITIANDIDLTAGLQSGEFIGFSKLIDGVDSLKSFLWYVIALAVMWEAMKVASKKAIITKGIVDSITAGIQGVGSFVAKAPGYLPWIPVYNKQKGDGQEKIGQFAPMDLFTMGKRLPGKWQSDSRRRVNEMFNLNDSLRNISKGFQSDVGRLTEGKMKEILDHLGKSGNSTMASLSSISDPSLQVFKDMKGNDPKELIDYAEQQFPNLSGEAQNARSNLGLSTSSPSNNASPPPVSTAPIRITLPSSRPDIIIDPSKMTGSAANQHRVIKTANGEIKPSDDDLEAILDKFGSMTATMKDEIKGINNTP